MSTLTHARRSIFVAVVLVAAVALASFNEASGWGKNKPKAPSTGSLPPNPNGLGKSLPSRLPFSSGKGGVYWVDPVHGSDRGRGTEARPWRTLNRALARVPLSGSIVKVLPGTLSSSGQQYAVQFNRHGDVRDPITVEAVHPGSVTITNGDLGRDTIGIWLIGASGLRLEGLRFSMLARPSSGVGTTGILIENSDRIEIMRCIFDSIAGSGLAVRGGAGSSSDDDWLIGNVFRPSGADPTAQATGLGFSSSVYEGSKGSHWVYAGQYGVDGNWEQVSGTRNLVITNNVFTGTAAGRDVELGPQARNSFVVNNTFYGNRSATVIGRSTGARYAGQGVELFSNSSTSAYTNGYNVIANNLFAELDGHAVAGSGPAEPGNIVRDNIYWAISGTDDNGSIGSPLAPTYDGTVIFDIGPRNRNANPRLGNVRRYDFHPGPRSPALHAAAAEYSYPYDLEGRLRPHAPSIGALERP